MAALIGPVGTAAAAWTGWRSALPAAPLDELVPDGALVVAPHPDDEVLACGGLLAVLAAAGRPARVLAVTDGEASHPGSARWPASRLATTRPQESAAALRLLGVEAPVRLGQPDGAVDPAAVADAVANAVRPGDTVLTTWTGDGHPDHEATGRGARAGAAAAGAPVLEVPVWAWHWAGPGDPRVPWARAVALELPPEVRARKVLALRAFRSQLIPDGAAPPVVPAALAATLTGPREVLLR